MADRKPDWLARSADYLRDLVDQEGSLLFAPEGKGGVRRSEQAPEPTSVAGAEPARGSGLEPVPEPSDEMPSTFQQSLGAELASPPWGGSPPRPDVDPAGIPASMTSPVPDSDEARAALLTEFNRETCTCLKCPLGETRTNHVFGVGNPNASLMLIGEAPGAEEDRQGEPFVGRAGQLLNRILAAIEFRREDVYIANILKCRPPGNRDPRPEEVGACEPHLHRQIELIQPVVICALGRIAAQTLLKTKKPLGKLREKIHRYQGRPLVVTFHPAALLRNPNWKRPAWEDVQRLKKIHDERLGS